jgi:hypothetical protein
MTKKTFLDAAERIGTAFLGGVIGNLGMVEVVNALGGHASMTFWQNLLAGGIMAAISTIKAMIGANKSGTTTPVSIL